MKHRVPDAAPPTGRHRGAVDRPAPAPHRRAVAVVVGLLVAAAGTVALVVGGGNDHPAAAAGTSPGATSDHIGAADAAADATAADPAADGHPAAATAAATATACPLSAGRLTVAAAPAVGAAIQHFLDAGAPAPDGCPVALTLIEPADLLDGLSDPATAPAVWIPDSSIWLDRARARGVAIDGDATSVAATSVVLAMTAADAARIATDGTPDLDEVLATRGTAHPIRVDLPDPHRSAVGTLAVTDLQRALDRAPDHSAALAWALRSTPAGAGPGPAAVADGLLVATTAQTVRAAAGPSSPVRVAAATPSVLDHPFAVLSPDARTAGVAAALLAGLLSPAGREALSDSGFDAPVAAGVDHAAVTAAERDYDLANAPSRMLAVLDTSGSMAAAVPGAAGASRLDLARAAAQQGLSLYGDDSEIGIWVFSRHLDGTSDHRELAPIQPLVGVVDGMSQRDRVAGALAGVTVTPDGGTGLYDTALAAIRTVRDGWVPGRVNAVLLLTDGRNDDAGSIDLPVLLTTIADEQDPDRPVPVIAIGFGPDTDTAALDAITAATGGATYVADDPRQVGEIFLDAVGQRPCRPGC